MTSHGKITSVLPLSYETLKDGGHINIRVYLTEE